MIRCTYIVLIQNNEDNILALIESLKNIEGNFRKEFIFVDDGSTDKSLNILKTAVNDLPRTTIITQSNQGPTLSINKAANLATGDYIHFVDGGEILHRDSSSALIEACLNFGLQVAFGKVSNKPLSKNSIKANAQIIDKPIESILLNKEPNNCCIGSSASLVNRDLLNIVGKADSSVYVQNTSLSLRCAKNSKFIYIPACISYIKQKPASEDQRFYSYNKIKSIYNFAKANEEFASKFIPQLLKALSYETASKGDKISYSMRSLASKYLKSHKISAVLEYYKKEVDKLF